MPSSTAAMTTAVATAVGTRPAMRAPAGTGVARRRLSTPRSRWAVTEATRLPKQAAMTPSAMMPGT